MLFFKFSLFQKKNRLQQAVVFGLIIHDSTLTVNEDSP